MPGAASDAPTPLGATLNADGTATFAVISNAHMHDNGRVVLCLFANDGEETQYPLERPDSVGRPDVWAGTVSDVRTGQRYGFRASGADKPSDGVYFDPRLLLSDPYARAFTPNPLDARRPYSVVVPPAPPGGHDTRPGKALEKTIIYETNVRALTIGHPDVPARLRGTYSALPYLATYFKNLGVTAVELQPVQQHVTEKPLLDHGLVNLWGYSTLGFFAPDFRYSSSGSLGEQVEEFRRMVSAMHDEELEIILDVAYNHTAEGGPDQPALSWRGLANDLYYLLDPHDRSLYADDTGCGNTLDFGRPYVQDMTIDSLKYWAEEMQVDGFRFDLATTLLRHDGAVDTDAPFLSRLHSTLPAKTKLIAEPWDSGPFERYELGQFPAPWTQWNDRFRDATRRFWLADAAPGELRERLAGSPDLIAEPLQPAQTPATAFVEYVAAHDGRTAYDLVAYASKHNEANLDDNQDGPTETAINYGTEGPSTDPIVEWKRLRDVRALLATTLMARGVPMLLGGDELLRTQRGNNNAYCQDNAVSWYDWRNLVGNDVISLITRLTSFRERYPEVLVGWGVDAPTGVGAPPGVKVWAQPTLGSGCFLGVVCRCPRAESPAIQVAVMINSSDTNLTARPPVRGTGPWTVEWTSHPDAPTARRGLVIDARSVVGASRPDTSPRRVSPRAS